MKNIIVTGTGRGIGYALALQFANAGHQVLAISRQIPKALAEHSNVTCLSVDLTLKAKWIKFQSFFRLRGKRSMQ